MILKISFSLKKKEIGNPMFPFLKKIYLKDNNLLYIFSKLISKNYIFDSLLE